MQTHILYITYVSYISCENIKINMLYIFLLILILFHIIIERYIINCIQKMKLLVIRYNELRCMSFGLGTLNT